ncbi:hypothetical protein YM304_10070 [Ilumatobacter coccineus YM16-304]|uniref:Uncharacterized protein n=1 Tax=Ilumatobacter coccineus (strain NBRC 103263 / KCTC 29153 / YM16-304) TaxID=1313172 RepID=A0A6C7E3R1_ILUCY|nr:hypothetical protein YM304_10070 [Ilumatobacter coccineus YM16-304]
MLLPSKRPLDESLVSRSGPSRRRGTTSRPAVAAAIWWAKSPQKAGANITRASTTSSPDTPAPTASRIVGSSAPANTMAMTRRRTGLDFTRASRTRAVSVDTIAMIRPLVPMTALSSVEPELSCTWAASAYPRIPSRSGIAHQPTQTIHVVAKSVVAMRPSRRPTTRKNGVIAAATITVWNSTAIANATAPPDMSSHDGRSTDSASAMPSSATDRAAAANIVGVAEVGAALIANTRLSTTVVSRAAHRPNRRDAALAEQPIVTSANMSDTIRTALIPPRSKTGSISAGHALDPLGRPPVYPEAEPTSTAGSHACSERSGPDSAARVRIISTSPYSPRVSAAAHHDGRFHASRGDVSIAASSRLRRMTTIGDAMRSSPDRSSGSACVRMVAVRTPRRAGTCQRRERSSFDRSSAMQMLGGSSPSTRVSIMRSTWRVSGFGPVWKTTKSPDDRRAQPWRCSVSVVRRRRVRRSVASARSGTRIGVHSRDAGVGGGTSSRRGASRVGGDQVIFCVFRRHLCTS